MLVYLLNIILIIILGYFLLYEYPTKQNRKFFCIIVAIQWIIISGLRDWSIGSDTYAYYLSFEETKNISWETIFNWNIKYFYEEIPIKDPGYILFEKIFQIFSGNYQVYLITIAVIFTAPMAIWVYKNSANPCISFIIYSALFYSFYAVTGHRQSIATALVCFVGYKYIKERKPIKFLLISFIAFMIHKSSIVFVIVFFISLIPLTATYKIISWFSVITVSLLGKQLYEPIALALGFKQQQIDYEGGGAETYAFVLTLLCIVFFVFFSYIKRKRTDANIIYNIMMLTLMSSLLVFQNQGFMRIQQYYSLYIMLIIPDILMYFKGKDRILVNFTFGAVCILYLIRNNPQYLFFWQ